MAKKGEPLNFRFPDNEPDIDFKMLNANRTFLVLSLQGDNAPTNPNEMLISGMATYCIDNMFRTLKPVISVSLETGDPSNEFLNATILFSSIKSFEPEQIIQQVPLLKALLDKQNLLMGAGWLFEDPHFQHAIQHEPVRIGLSYFLRSVLAELKQSNEDSQRLRVEAKKALRSVGGLVPFAKLMAYWFKIPTLRYFSSEQAEDIEKRTDWIWDEDFKSARVEAALKLTTLLPFFEWSNFNYVVTTAKKQVQRLLNDNLIKICDKSRDLERAWRELNLFYTNVAEYEVRHLTVLNLNKSVDINLIWARIATLLDNANTESFDKKDSYSLFVAPGFWGKEWIWKVSDVAHRNNILFLTDFKDETSVEAVLKSAKTLDLGGKYPFWKHTVLFANYGLLRREYYMDYELSEPLYGSVAAAVAGKLYATDNIAQPVAGAKWGALNGLSGLRFPVQQAQIADLERFNLNPIADVFGSLMPMNAVTMFLGENMELQPYNVVRLLDYMDKTMKHLCIQFSFCSIRNKGQQSYVERSINHFLKKMCALNLLQSAKIVRLEVERDEQFNITVLWTPMYAFQEVGYRISIHWNAANSSHTFLKKLDPLPFSENN